MSSSSLSSCSSSNDIKAKLKGLFHRHNPRPDASVTQVVVCKRFAKIPMHFLSVRKKNTHSHNQFLFIFNKRNVDKCEKLPLKILIMLTQMKMLV